MKKKWPEVDKQSQANKGSQPQNQRMVPASEKIQTVQTGQMLPWEQSVPARKTIPTRQTLNLTGKKLFK